MFFRIDQNGKSSFDPQYQTVWARKLKIVLNETCFDIVYGYLMIIYKFNESSLGNEMFSIDFVLCKIKIFTETASVP